MENDAESKALEAIIRNDARQRMFVYALLIAAFVLFSFVVVSGKNAIIKQIKSVTQSQAHIVEEAQKDKNIRTEESRRYITCLLTLTVTARDEAGQKYCYDQSDLPGGRTSKEFNPVTVDPNGAEDVTVPSAAKASSNSYSHPTPKKVQEQSDTSQVQPQQSTQTSTTKEPTPTVTPPAPFLELVLDHVNKFLGGL
jgi:hypothetical protein